MQITFLSPRFVVGGALLLAVAAVGWIFTKSPPRATRVKPITAQALLAKVREPGASLSVINVWATWCEPCRREMPGFVRLQDRKDIRVLMVSADDPATDPADDAIVDSFLAEQNVNFETYRVQESATEFMRQLQPSWSGSLPATFFYKQDGRLHSFYLGELSEETLRQKVEGGLKTP
ncbi:MAG: TlpA family protein disulfide reductase [Bdellovibrionaceae bacterium]|nr:TlpA family protein disulfide reductase [Pseudobdellovibrionaceae bacterium]